MIFFIKQCLYSLCKDSLFFFFLSLVLLMPFNIFSDKYIQEIKTIVMEHIAPHSLTAMLVIAIFVTSLTLLFIGKKNNNKKINIHIYTFIVFPVVKVGKAYASTMVGMMTGSALVSFLFEDVSKTPMHLLLISYIIMHWFLFEVIMYLSINGLPSNVSKKVTNIFLIMIALIIPAWYFYNIYSN